MNKSNKFSPEACERAVRMVQERRGEYPSLWAAVESIAPKIGCVLQTLLDWVKRTEVDAGSCPGTITAEAKRMKELEREVKELRRANDILRTASTFFAQPQAEISNAYIDQHRDAYGVEPSCKVLQVAPSAYRRHAARQRKPELRSARAKRDELLVPDIERVWQGNLQVYGADKV